MNWEQALEAMRQGHKVKNPYFCNGEYFHMVAGRVYGEDDVSMAGWYKGADWQWGGWSIVEDEA